MRKISARLATVALVTGTTLGGWAVAPASAATVPSCTITAAQRTAIVDQIKALAQAEDRIRPTTRQATALGASIAELQAQYRQQRLTATQTDAKAAELAALARKLSAATSATERAAIRTEMASIRQQLAAPHLTSAQVAALKAKLAEQRIQLAPQQATGTQIDWLGQRIAALSAKLACRTV